jgi:N-acetylmuramoyl-L-alanine amidase
LKKFARGPRALRLGAIALLLALPFFSAYARTHKSSDWASNQFDTAERMREALNGRPVKERSRAEYQKVVNAYRRIYFEAPTAGRASYAVVAEAEVMVEMGRQFNDEKILRNAIHKYEFLRKEYPGAEQRVDALFTIGEIYKDDLNDPDNARDTFAEFLRRYPKSHQADDARKALSGIEQAALKTKDAPVSKTSDKTVADKTAPDKKVVSDPPADDSQADESDDPVRVTGIRYWSAPEYTRIAIDLEQDVKFDSQRIESPDRIYFDLKNTKLASTLVGKSFDVNDGFLKQIRVGQFQADRTRVVLEVDSLSEYNTFLLSNPSRLIIDVHGKQQVMAKAAPSKPAVPAKAEETVTTTVKNGVKKVVVAPADDDAAPSKTKKVVTAKLEKPEVVGDDTDTPATAPAPAPKKSTVTAKGKGKRKAASPDFDIHESQPTASGDRSLIRALGLKIGRIVIDPGHGGHDSGTIGPNGLEEKDLVLEVGRRLGKLLESRLGAEVVYTRSDDTFIPLETRTAIANQEQADLFVSIHANSSNDPDARGVETYYLNFTSSPEALEVAARENAVSSKSIHELQDLVKKIALKEKIEESKEFASDVQTALHSGLATKGSSIRNRGVKKAPFIVLIGANMPSILAEISFVSNPTDERRLRTPEYRQKIAESLYRGISKYVTGLGGVKVASKLDKGVEQ